MIARRTPLRRSAIKPKRYTKIKWRSPKKGAADRKYEKAKKEHFGAHPKCQHPDGCTKSILNGDKLDLHHRAGRTGPLLYAKKYFATACRPHHDLAKSKPIESRANGWIVDVSHQEVWEMGQREILTGEI